MKRILLAFLCIYMLGACSLFRRSNKVGCPNTPKAGELSMDQKIASGQNVKQSKYKGGRKIY